MLLFSTFTVQGLGLLYQSKHFQSSPPAMSGSLGPQLDSPPFLPFNSALCLGAGEEAAVCSWKTNLEFPPSPSPTPNPGPDPTGPVVGGWVMAVLVVPHPRGGRGLKEPSVSRGWGPFPGVHGVWLWSCSLASPAWPPSPCWRMGTKGRCVVPV